MKELQTVDFPIYMLILLFIVKLLFSIICFSSGVPGGIFFPILVLGATVGTIFGKIIDPIYINSFIILGMAGYLTAIVRAPLTSIILIFEMTGNLSYLLPLSIVCLITYSIPNYFLHISSILLLGLLRKINLSTSLLIRQRAIEKSDAFCENKFLIFSSDSVLLICRKYRGIS